MLERIREGSQGTWAVVILGLVILSFVFAGVGGYVSSSGSAAASVNGDEIPQTTFERMYDTERSRLESQFGEAFAALAADSAYLNQFKQSVLDRLIAEKLIEQVAIELGLRVSNEQINQQLLNMPEFQIGGQFNNDRFQATLRSVGFQPSSFREYMRNEMTRRQVATALIGSEFSLDNEATNILNLQQQTRDIQFITVSTAPFTKGVEVNDDDIDVYYQLNLADFDTQERLSLEYIELNADDLMVGMEATDEELQALYESSIKEFQTEEERRVSHILVENVEDAGAAATKIQSALDRLNAGEDFAVVAQDVSDDLFSAENGGDLGFIENNSIGEDFGEAAFALNAVGDFTDVVETEAGLHIIKLTELKAGQVTSFEEVKDTLVERIKREKAIEQLYIIQTEVETLAFEIPDSLVEVAETTNLEVKSTELFTREAAPTEVSNPLVIATAFSDELLLEGVNSEVLSVGTNHFMVVRVKEHEPERTKALEEVKDDIVASLTTEKAQAAAKEWTESLLAELQAGTEIEAKLTEKELGWELQAGVGRFGGVIPSAVVEKAFQLSTAAGDNQAVVELASGDMGLVQLNNVNQNAETPEEQVIALQQRMAKMQSQGIYTSLIEALKVDADISVYNLTTR